MKLLDTRHDAHGLFVEGAVRLSQLYRPASMIEEFNADIELEFADWLTERQLRGAVRRRG